VVEATRWEEARGGESGSGGMAGMLAGLCVGGAYFAVGGPAVGLLV
jgi:hypothetical protein